MKELGIADVFAPLGDADLVRAFVEKEFTHCVQTKRERFEYLFSWSLVNSLLSQNLLGRDRLRVSRDGRDIPPALYRREDERASVDAEKLLNILSQNASLVINRVQDLSPAVRRLARLIERRLGQHVNVNGYLSFGAGGAFDVHYDTHDVLVLQIYGSKRWFIYDCAEDAPLAEAKIRGLKPSGIKIVEEFDLSAGDVIFVPRGTYHRAEITDQDSVHLTFGIHSGRGVDFFDFIKKKIVNYSVLRRDIHRLETSEQFSLQERAIKDQLHSIIEEASLAEFAAYYEDGREFNDSFNLGPKREMNAETILAPLVRNSRSFQGSRTGSGDDIALAQRVLDLVCDRDSISLGELYNELNGELEREAVNCAVASLVASRFVEILS